MALQLIESDAESADHLRFPQCLWTSARALICSDEGR